MKRVFVIGLDGLDPGIVEPMLAAGELPNLGRLRARGGSARVATTTPAQTPVAWSTFATGVNPGGHGIFDFLRRDPATYLPDLALNRYEQKNAFVPARAVNLRRGTPVWDVLSEAGIESTILRCPCTYPPDTFRGRMLSGMGVPDLRGGFGTATAYLTDDEAVAGEGEGVVRVRPDADGVIVTHLIGPRNPKDRENFLVAMTIRRDGADSATLAIDGVSAPVRLPAGRWSGWVEVAFKVGMFRSIRGLVRFLLVRAGPDFALYASPINMAPASPMFPISSPDAYAGELARAIGPFYTAGMVEDHAGLSNGRIDEAAFLDQCAIAWREREAMLHRELDRFEAGLLYCLFDTPDRIQHMFWRFREPDHPANRGERPPAEFASAIEDAYRRGDAIVGDVLERARDDDLVIALSDHGFGSFRRGVSVNAWLHRRGFLALRDGLAPGEEAGDMLLGIDWSRTRAYGVGLSGIYLNLRGREGRGIVSPDDAESLKAEIAGGLSGLRDPDGGVAIRAVRAREACYSGPYVGEAPDLLVQCGAGYRLSWGTSLGGVSRDVFEDNTRKWSGDHIVDPALVPGVLFMSRSFRGEGAGLADLAPTILEALGLPKASFMEGRSLLT